MGSLRGFLWKERGDLRFVLAIPVLLLMMACVLAPTYLLHYFKIDSP